jgi:hypothetical protein
MALATTQGREHAVAALTARREANKDKIYDNSIAPAGSPMYFACISCNGVAESCPESYTWIPRKLCKECQAMKDMGWL